VRPVTVDRVPTKIDRPTKPALPKPAPINMLPVRWEVLNVEGVPYFALTAEQYQNLSRNQAEILRWVQEANHQLQYYTDEGGSDE